MEQQKLEELVKDGWNNTNSEFAGYHIYKRDNEAMLYDPKEDKVIVRYSCEFKQNGVNVNYSCELPEKIAV